MTSQASKAKKKPILTYAFVWGTVATAMAFLLFFLSIGRLIQTGHVEILAVIGGLVSAAIAITLLAIDRKAQPRDQ